MTITDGSRPTTVDEYTEWNARELARTRVTRRSVLRAGAGGASALVLSQFTRANAAFAAAGGRAGSAGVAISGRHLSFVSGHDGRPETAMAVTAQLVSKTGSLPRDIKAYVEVGREPGQYGHRVDAEIVHLLGAYAIPGGPIGSQFYAKATMTGLRAQSVYHYRVVLSDATMSGDAYFTTAPVRSPARPGHHGRHEIAAPFTFTAFADVGTNIAPTDPKYAWGQDPASVQAAGGTWPHGVFDNNYYNPADPVAGTSGLDPRPAATLVNDMSSQDRKSVV